HKILSGRRRRFDTLRQTGGISGFPRRGESEADAFSTGHASTSISAALGLLAGAHLTGGAAAGAGVKDRVLAVIGDGALTGGMAYEGLSCTAHLGLPLIIVLNDNRMSISPNVGGLSRHLSRLSMRQQYQTFRGAIDSMTRSLPFAGEAFFNAIQRLKRAVKAVVYQDNFFVELGFEYVGPIDGHNVRLLADVFSDVRALGRPVVVHVLTRKGKGYRPAELDPGAFHSVPPFSRESGALPSGGENWTRVFGSALVEAAGEDSRVSAITAAMERGTGLQRFRAAFPQRFFDAGIAEAHAVTFAAALAAAGLRPVVAIYSTFIQRAIDSIIHDTAMEALPVVFALDRAGFVGGDGETHQGLLDICLLRAVPNMTLLSPADSGELRAMLAWALAHGGPCAIRYPKAEAPPASPDFAVPITAGRGVLVRRRPEAAGDVCLAFTGGLFPQASGAAALLDERGVSCDLYNLRFLSAIDQDYLTGIISGYRLFAVAEEGLQNGGIGEYITRLAAAAGFAEKIVLCNAGDVFYGQSSRGELLREAGLDAESIARRI
ncbi:MAG: 1-deoxy-D-xylulose-5-phosphate synthase, partial [Spirochaetaceae bacterium]|nr:1-deoxy-D-xylulose-5-phosphate synthase [Spirochaetaceae bacterium]